MSKSFYWYGDLPVKLLDIVLFASFKRRDWRRWRNWAIGAGVYVRAGESVELSLNLGPFDFGAGINHLKF